MIGWGSLGDRIREMQVRNRREREADLSRRLALMTPVASAHWSSVIERALPLARKVQPSRPCDYRPWASALTQIEKVDAEWPLRGPYPWPVDPGSLMSFADMVGCPGWPEDHAHLVDFALLFIEADVMLFRSGYTKRHMLRRLRQASLDASQTERVRRIVRNGVENGTGLEEFREIRRIAARVADEALTEWLAEKAEGVVLTLDSLDVPDYIRVFETLDETALRKLSRAGWGWTGSRNWGFTPIGPPDLVKKANIPQDNRIKVNAWRILRHIDRVSGAERNQPWA